MDEIKQFSIKIVTSAELKAAQDSAKALQDVGTAGKESGEMQKKAGKEIEEVEKKALASKKDLRAMVRGLALEFPVLGHVARIAVDPLARTVMVVTAAFAIFAARVREATRAMSQAVLPDISPQKIGQVTAYAEAWNAFREALGGASAAYNSIEAASNRAIKRMEAEAEQQQKLLKARKGLELADLEARRGGMSGGDYERGKLAIEDRYERAGISADQAKRENTIYARQEEARELRRNADKKLQDSAKIRVSTAEQDAQTEGDLKGRAEAAQKSIDEHRARIGNYRAYAAGEGSLADRMKWRLGINVATGSLAGMAPTPAMIEQAIGIEQMQITPEMANVNRYNAFLRNKPAREAARKRKFGLAGEAGAEFGRAGVLEAEMGEESAAASGDFLQNRQVGNINAIARGKEALGKARADESQALDELINIAQRGGGITAMQQQQIRQLHQKVTELEKLVRESDGRTPRI